MSEISIVFVDINDLKRILFGWYRAMDAEWYGEGSAWDIIDPYLEKYNLTREEVSQFI